MPDEEFAPDVAETMALSRDEWFGQDILGMIERAITAMRYEDIDPLVWRDRGIGIHVSDILHDCHVAIRRLRNMPPELTL